MAAAPSYSCLLEYRLPIIRTRHHQMRGAQSHLEGLRATVKCQLFIRPCAIHSLPFEPDHDAGMVQGSSVIVRMTVAHITPRYVRFHIVTVKVEAVLLRKPPATEESFQPAAGTKQQVGRYAPQRQRRCRTAKMTSQNNTVTRLAIDEVKVMQHAQTHKTLVFISADERRRGWKGPRMRNAGKTMTCD
jgi:hypothetical protein